MNHNSVRLIVMTIFRLNGAGLFGQEQASLLTLSAPRLTNLSATQPAGQGDNSETPMSGVLGTLATISPAQSGGAFQSNTFVYAGRTSNGNRCAANIRDIRLDIPLRHGLCVTAYYGHAWEKSLIANISWRRERAIRLREENFSVLRRH